MSMKYYLYKIRLYVFFSRNKAYINKGGYEEVHSGFFFTKRNQRIIANNSLKMAPY